MKAPSENRFIKALRRVPTDRVPIFEHVIDQRFVKYATGLAQRASRSIWGVETLRIKPPCLI